jgi:FAD/FMN-containing dehydrogenase
MTMMRMTGWNGIYAPPAAITTTDANELVAEIHDRMLLCYAVWEREEDDPANAAWHSEAIATLDEFAVGQHVGDADIVTTALRAERSYAPPNWKRLQLLREKYDPSGLFLGHFR